MFQTPQKTTASRFASASHSQHQHPQHNQQPPPMQVGTPQNKSSRSNSSSQTPKSFVSTTSGNFSLFPVVDTPPSRYMKVVNPFEAALADRLHLPLICSPSIFQRANTPQHSSTQFEWTIEEVSSMCPANVEPNETQFQATPDPVLEAKAQAAISSYFKDQINVPSPADCPLRGRKIALDEIINSNSPPVRSGRRMRDGVAQTVMSIPPIDAPEIEEMLKPFLTYTVEQQQSPTVACDVTLNYEAQDISLRRKLFGVPFMNYDKQTAETNNEIEDDSDDDVTGIDIEHSPPPRSPDLHIQQMPMRGFGSPFSNNSFGELSPISKLNSDHNAVKRAIQNESLNSTVDVTDEDDFNFENNVHIFKSTQQSSVNALNGGNENTQNQSLFRSTPDRSTASNIITDMSVDVSCNKNTTRRHLGMGSRILFGNDSSDQSFCVTEEDDMQISQLSAKSTSSSSSSQHSDTPIRRRNRSASRKNLSRSFSCPVTDDEDEMDSGMVVLKKAATASDNLVAGVQQGSEIACGGDYTGMNSTEHSVFYRADSGFNEMTTQDESKFRHEMDMLKRNVVIVETDVSMTS